jgi:hypothetical protein
MTIRSVFTDPPQQLPPAVRYGLLLALVGLLAFDLLRNFVLFPTFHPDHYANTVVILMMLFSHLAFQFRWPSIATVALRAVVFMSLLFGLPYILFVVVTMFRAG